MGKAAYWEDRSKTRSVLIKNGHRVASVHDISREVRVTARKYEFVMVWVCVIKGVWGTKHYRTRGRAKRAVERELQKGTK